jgi:hypothetical protein
MITKENEQFNVARVNGIITAEEEQEYSRSCSRVGSEFQVTIPEIEANPYPKPNPNRLDYDSTDYSINNGNSNEGSDSETYWPLWGTDSARNEWGHGGPNMQQLIEQFKEALKRYVSC